MEFIYEICPHCMNQLVQRIQPIEDVDSVNYCSQCGKKMVAACFGEQKIDGTVYQIILNDASVSDYRDRKNEFLSTLMKIGGFNLEDALEKYGMKDCVIFEGNVSDTYVNMNLLDGFTPDIHYTVIPPFPFERLVNPLVSICPTCGSDTIYKTEDTDNPPDYIMDGFFCEVCNEWVMFNTIPKLDVDETKYKLEFCLGNPENEEEAAIKKMVEELPDKRIISNKIIVCDNACNIHQILEGLKTLCIDYDIKPPYPHRIDVHKELTEEDLKLLMEMNPGLTVTLEEMNALN